jgi:hypothetical protein
LCVCKQHPGARVDGIPVRYMHTLRNLEESAEQAHEKRIPYAWNHVHHDGHEQVSARIINQQTK